MRRLLPSHDRAALVSGTRNSSRDRYQILSRGCDAGHMTPRCMYVSTAGRDMAVDASNSVATHTGDWQREVSKRLRP